MTIGHNRRPPAVPQRFVGRGHAGGRRLGPATSGYGEAAMRAVYLVTTGSGDTYRIERVYLDRDEAERFARDYNGMAPNEPVQVEE